MTFNEAVEKVIDVIPSENIAEFDEVIETLRSGNATDTSVEYWKDKYEELTETYKRRFKESLNTDIHTDVKEDEREEEPKEIDVNALDFSAETE